MENLETIILVAASLALACAFDSTATCKLMLLVARGSQKINESARPAISRIRRPLPAVPTAGHAARSDHDIGVPREDRRKASLRVGSAVVVDLRAWKYDAASRVGLDNSRRPIAVRSCSPVGRPGAA